MWLAKQAYYNYSFSFYTDVWEIYSSVKLQINFQLQTTHVPRLEIVVSFISIKYKLFTESFSFLSLFNVSVFLSSFQVKIALKTNMLCVTSGIRNSH